MRALLIPIVVFGILPVHGTGLNAQQLTGVFADSQQVLTAGRGSAVEQKAWNASDLMPGVSAVVATRRVGTRSITFVRGWTAGGTGAGQVSYLAFEATPNDSVRLVWSAPAYEYSYPPRRLRASDPPYSLHGCLYVIADGRIAFATRGAPKQRAFNTPPLPRSGYYRWSDAVHAFHRVAAADSQLLRACHKEPDSEYK